MVRVEGVENVKNTRIAFSYIRFFDDKTPSSIEELGGKGYSLAQMTAAGIPVPQGFTIKASEWGRIYYNEDSDVLPTDIDMELQRAIHTLEHSTGKVLGDYDFPLTYSLRSGAKVSMPGMMKTILNLGITDKTLPGLITSIGERAALDAYQRLIRMYSSSVYGIDHSVFREIEAKVDARTTFTSPIDRSRQLVDTFKKVVEIETGHTFEQDVWRQLRDGTKAIANSFMDPGAVEYRMAHGISHDIGTAVHVQEMVYGNANEKSGTAVIFTRDPRSGKKKLSGHYMPGEQGETVVRGDRTGLPLDSLPPEVYEQIVKHVDALERIVGDVADIETTWEYRSGKLNVYFLQVRAARLSPIGTIASAVEMEQEGLMTATRALSRVNSGHIDAVLRPHLDTEDAMGVHQIPDATGDPLRTGAGVGHVYSDVEKAKAAVRKGEHVVLICRHFDPNDIELIVGSVTESGTFCRAQAICTTEGTPSSHMGIIMTEAGMPGIMGITGVSIGKDGKITMGNITVEDGAIVSIDGDLGHIFCREMPVRTVELSPQIMEFIRRWKDLFGEKNQWADFINPESGEHIQTVRKFDEIVSKAHTTFGQCKKAEQIFIESEAFPPQIHIHSEVFPITDLKGIEKAVESAAAAGCSVWARSDNGELRAPYTSGDLTVNEVRDDWLSNPQSPYSKWGGIKRWKDEFHVKYIMIGFDPKEKLDKGFIQEHFVGTIRCLSAIPPQIIVDVRDQTNQLRTMDEAIPEDRIRLTIVSNPSSPGKRGVPYFTFGRNHLDPRKVHELHELLSAGSTTEKTHHIIEIIRKHLNGEVLGQQTDEQFGLTLLSLVEEGLLPHTLFDAFITTRAVNVVRYIYKTLFDDWWKRFNMPAILWALRESTGASVLEFQGRIASNGKDWLKIYGTKGGEESQRVQTVRTANE